jgi:hypothetical protein
VTFLFTRYKKTDGDTKVLLLYLLLNNYDLSQITRYEEAQEDESFGLKIYKLYGVTKEYIDVARIEQELSEIQCPIICSPLSFEYYSKAPKIYKMTKRIPEKPLYINDLNVISKHMIITEDTVVSANPAKQVGDAENGFMYFYNYVLKDEMSIGKWTVSYKNKAFDVFYKNTLDASGTSTPELMYRAEEMDKTTTYKLVIYIIKKTIGSVDGIKGDNFVTERYEVVKE